MSNTHHTYKVLSYSYTSHINILQCLLLKLSILKNNLASFTNAAFILDLELSTKKSLHFHLILPCNCKLQKMLFSWEDGGRVVHWDEVFCCVCVTQSQLNLWLSLITRIKAPFWLFSFSKVLIEWVFANLQEYIKSSSGLLWSYKVKFVILNRNIYNLAHKIGIVSFPMATAWWSRAQSLNQALDNSEWMDEFYVREGTVPRTILLEATSGSLYLSLQRLDNYLEDWLCMMLTTPTLKRKTHCHLRPGNIVVGGMCCVIPEPRILSELPYVAGWEADMLSVHTLIWADNLDGFTIHSHAKTTKWKI